MRTISSKDIYTTVCNLIVETNFNLSAHVEKALAAMHSHEDTPLAKHTLSILVENAKIARTKHIPLCQDCGSVIIFIELGNKIYIDSNCNEIIQKAVADTYRNHYLRPSMVKDPLFDRTNTSNNTPAFIHYDIVEGDTFEITVYLKGGGSENMTALKMFTPTSGPEDIMHFIVDTVKNSGPNPCPPLFIGIGIGGTADIAMINAKKAVLREHPHTSSYYRDLEENILHQCNETHVGPLGFGGKNTVAMVRIIEAPTHIATLPVAVNLNCHSLRYRKSRL